MTTPLAYGHRNDFPPGHNDGATDQTYHCEYPEQAGFVNNEIADEDVIRAYLTYYGFGPGLSRTFLENANRTPVRYIVTDFSAEMNTRQTRLVEIKPKKNPKSIPVTHWDEIKETFQFHSGLAHVAHAATEFRIGRSSAANGPILVGGLGTPDRSELLYSRYQTGPQRTNLCKEIREIVAEISLNAAQLKALGKRIVIAIYTDEIPLDGNMLECLMPINELPVMLVVRLCTDSEYVIAFWNSLKVHLTVRVDILREFITEAIVKKDSLKNSWLTYGLPLHRMREFGLTIKDSDKDENSNMHPQELKTFLAYLFGTSLQSIPDPVTRYRDFMFTVAMLNEQEGTVFGPVTSRMVQWLEFKGLKESYSFDRVTSVDGESDDGMNGNAAGCCGQKPKKKVVKKDLKKDVPTGRGYGGPEPPKKPDPSGLCFAEGTDEECCVRYSEEKECCAGEQCLPKGGGKKTRSELSCIPYNDGEEEVLEKDAEEPCCMAVRSRNAETDTCCPESSCCIPKKKDVDSGSDSKTPPEVKEAPVVGETGCCGGKKTEVKKDLKNLDDAKLNVEKAPSAVTGAIGDANVNGNVTASGIATGNGSVNGGTLAGESVAEESVSAEKGLNAVLKDVEMEGEAKADEAQVLAHDTSVSKDNAEHDTSSSVGEGDNEINPNIELSSPSPSPEKAKETEVDYMSQDMKDEIARDQAERAKAVPPVKPAGCCASKPKPTANPTDPGPQKKNMCC